jgi:hypothetical protein
MSDSGQDDSLSGETLVVAFGFQVGRSVLPKENNTKLERVVLLKLEEPCQPPLTFALTVEKARALAAGLVTAADEHDSEAGGHD